MADCEFKIQDSGCRMADAGCKLEIPICRFQRTVEGGELIMSRADSWAGRIGDGILCGVWVFLVLVPAGNGQARVGWPKAAE